MAKRPRKRTAKRKVKRTFSRRKGEGFQPCRKRAFKAGASPKQASKWCAGPKKKAAKRTRRRTRRKSSRKGTRKRSRK